MTPDDLKLWMAEQKMSARAVAIAANLPVLAVRHYLGGRDVPPPVAEALGRLIKKPSAERNPNATEGDPVMTPAELKSWMARNGMNPRDVAEAARVPVLTVNFFLDGNSPPSAIVAALKKLVQAPAERKPDAE